MARRWFALMLRLDPRRLPGYALEYASFGPTPHRCGVINLGAAVGLLSTLSGFFKREQSDFSAIFTAAALPGGSPAMATFPTKKFIGIGGIHAYRLRFHVSEAAARRVIAALASCFPLSKDGVVQYGLLRNAEGEAVNFTSTREFGGVVVEAITNSLRFMAALDALALAPVSPWDAFPKIEPSAFGSVPAAMDYWWDQIWLPFWSSRGVEQRAQYLDDQQASPEWRAFVDWHTPRGV